MADIKIPVSGELTGENVCLAEILAPHGIRGAVRLKSFTKDPASLFDYSELFDSQGVPFKIKYFATKQNGVFVVTIKGVTTCNAAELLRGIKLYVKRSVLPTPSEDEFYYTDMIGLPVVTINGEPIGIVSIVQNFGAGDLLEIKSAAGKIYTIPFTKEAVPQIDLKKREITIDSQFLLED